MVNAMNRFLTTLSPLLLPWAGLLLGLFTLSVGQWLALNASGTELLQMFMNDTLLLLKALPFWCLLIFPLLLLSPAWLILVQGISGTIVLIVLAGLDLYFLTAGVPLGADLFAYSWQEMRITMAGAQVSMPIELTFALAVSLSLLWGSLWLRAHHTQPVASSRTLALTLGVSLVSSLTLSISPATASLQTSNKLQFLLSDVWNWRHSHSAQDSNEYPFEHAETTKDSLGPLLDLDTHKRPIWCFWSLRVWVAAFQGRTPV